MWADEGKIPSGTWYDWVDRQNRSRKKEFPLSRIIQDAKNKQRLLWMWTEKQGFCLTAVRSELVKRQKIAHAARQAEYGSRTERTVTSTGRKLKRSHGNGWKCFYDCERFSDVENLNRKLKKHPAWNSNKPMKPLSAKSPVQMPGFEFMEALNESDAWVFGICLELP